MPPDLAAALDTDVCAELRARFASTSAWAYDDDPEAHVWWTQLLPDFVAELRAERDKARAERDKVRAAVHAACDAVLRQRDAAVAERDAAVAERDAAVAARDAAVGEALTWEWNVVRVQQSQQGTSGAEPGPHNHHSRKSACSCAGCPETPNVWSWWSDLSLLGAPGGHEPLRHLHSATQRGSKNKAGAWRCAGDAYCSPVCAPCCW